MTLRNVLDACASTHALVFDDGVPEPWRSREAAPDGSDRPTCLVVAAPADEPALLAHDDQYDAIAVLITGALVDAPLRVWARLLAVHGFVITELAPVGEPEPLTAIVARRLDVPAIELPPRLTAPVLADPAAELRHRLNRESVLEAELTSRASTLLQRRTAALRRQLTDATRETTRLQQSAVALDAYRRSRTFRIARRLSKVVRLVTHRR